MAGRILKRGKVKSFLDFLRLKLDLKEPEIIELLYPEVEEILKVTKIGRGECQRKAFVAVCKENGITGLGKKVLRLMK